MSAVPPQITALPERYEVTRHVADGGMASVWCAHDRMLGRSVALKVLSPQFARDEAGGRRFIREGRAAARLSGHAHVVTIFDIGAADGLPYIVMEYLAGGTVADAIRVGAVDRDQALKWIQEAASALDYAHKQGVVHRDVKPGNLLLDRDRTLHVADFGIAHLPTEDTLSSSRQMFGTAAYASPEQVRGERGSEASDRYALAVAAFELLVGERPFVAKPATAQARQHLEEQPPRASDRKSGMPTTVDEVLTRGMAKRPEDRWPTAGAFADALATAAAERPPAQSRPRRPYLSPPRRRPSGRVVALAALAAASTAVGAVVGTEANGPSRPRLGAAQSRVGSGRGSGTAAHRSGGSTAFLAAANAKRRRAAALEADGHQLMAEGDYAAAVPVLRRAIAAAGPGASQYASALLDLGRSLRLEGDPQAAIPVLERRLRIPRQTQAVVTQLELAQLAAGEGPVSASVTSPAPAAPAPEGTTTTTTQSTTTSSSSTTKQPGPTKPQHAGSVHPTPRPAGPGRSRPGAGSPASGGAAPFPPGQSTRAVRPPAPLAHTHHGR